MSNYGVVMKKSFSLFLLFAVIFAAAEAPAVNTSAADDKKASAYQLDEKAAAAYKLKEQSSESPSAAAKTKPDSSADVDAPQIVTQQIPGGRIEKLMDASGRVIAEKTIKGDEITEKVLNYYYPEGALSRRIVSRGEESGFFAEEYYRNGKLAASGSFLNEISKIGTERKYDVNGTLRQEIPWVLPKTEEKKPSSAQMTVLKGDVITYYPDGRVAARFAVGNNGKNTFFNRRGKVIKEISGVELLNFAPDRALVDCSGAPVRLSLKDLIELYEDEGDISYNKCGQPYRENFVYEITDITGQAATKISFDETGMIRRITPYIGGLKHGIEQKFDASGNLTAEISYKNGVKDGTAAGYFPTREPAFRKRYEKGMVKGALTCYFPDGKKAAEFFYKNGVKDGTAHIYGNTPRDIEFSSGKIIGEEPNKKSRRLVLPSRLSGVSAPDAGCLNLNVKLDDINLELAANINTVTKAFDLDIAEECTSEENFKSEKSKLACYDRLHRLRALRPVEFKRGEYAVETVYNTSGQLIYEIPYYQKKRQGFARKFDDKRRLRAEIYFNAGNIAESSRSYYENGAVKEMITIADGSPRKVLVRYGADGKTEFSVNYVDGKKTDAFFADKNKNKDIYLKFYDDKLENIREVNAGNPLNFIEYDLILGEYVVSKDGELIKGGKICGYDTLPEDVDVMPQAVLKKPEAASASPEIKPASPEIEPKSAPISASVAAVRKVLGKEDGAQESKTETASKPQDEIKQNQSLSQSKQKQTSKDVSQVSKPGTEYEEYSPLLPPEAAPMVEGLEPVSLEDFSNEDVLIPGPEEKREAELAAQNIGPVAKPGISELTDVVAKKTETLSDVQPAADEVKTEKLLYPNGNLRKTIKTRGARTEEVKEYSKTGLLLTDTMYNKDGILIEKYFGTGQIRRKTNKGYTDNPVQAFLSRQDFYDNGSKRYEISRQPQSLLFIEKSYYPDGTLNREIKQTSPFGFTVSEYDKQGKLIRLTESLAFAKTVKEYNGKDKLVSFALNGKKMPENLAKDSHKLLAESLKSYAKTGALAAEVKETNDKTVFMSYNAAGKPQTEITFFNNGGIWVKTYAKNSETEKMALLEEDGRLNIQKPEIRMIPAYRERWWVDYNNPRWIENTDKYNITSIARLSLDTAAHILAELAVDVPKDLQKLYEIY